MVLPSPITNTFVFLGVAFCPSFVGSVKSRTCLVLFFFCFVFTLGHYESLTDDLVYY